MGGLEQVEELRKVGSDYKFGFHTATKYKHDFGTGISEDLVRQISKIKNEPEWMLDLRLRSYREFLNRPTPTWGYPELDKDMNFDSFYYYSPPDSALTNDWDKVPKEIKETYERLGVPEAERKILAGSLSVFDSDSVVAKLRKEWADKGVIFTDVDTALREHSDLVKKYFMKAVPFTDNKFSALHGAVWSGGPFIYIPPGVKIDTPLQTYFRMNRKEGAQFEHTLIIADKRSEVTYIEGCLPDDELISLGDSLKQITALKIGDNVISHRGDRRTISKTFVHKHAGEMLTITPQSPLNAFRLTPEHPVLCVKRDHIRAKKEDRNGWLPETSTIKLLKTDPAYIEAGELKAGDFLVYVVPKDSKDTAELTEPILKILGLYLAEGSASFNKALNRRALQFSFGKTKDEKALAYELVEIIRSMGEKASVCRAARKYYTVSSYSKRLIEVCMRNCGTGAATKMLSKEVMELPTEKQRTFLEYYLKGDGNEYRKKKNKSLMIRASTASKILAFQLQEIVGRLGTFANLQLRKGGVDFINGRRILRKDQYVIEYTKDKKWSSVRHRDNLFLVPIKTIVRHKFEGNVFNIAVNADESYLVKGFAVHNCSAPVFEPDSKAIHAAIVEVFVGDEAKVKFISAENWSRNVYNLNTKRAIVGARAHMEWVEATLGSKVTMLYPASYLIGEGASSSNLTVSFAQPGTWKDSGSKVIMSAPNQTAKIISKSISMGSGSAVYRGLLRINKGASNARAYTQCDSLLLDDKAVTSAFPHNEVLNPTSKIYHEATVGKISKEKLFYLMSRGLTEAQARSLIVLGFLDSVLKAIPLEFAVEINKLIETEISTLPGATG